MIEFHFLAKLLQEFLKKFLKEISAAWKIGRFSSEETPFTLRTSVVFLAMQAAMGLAVHNFQKRCFASKFKGTSRIFSSPIFSCITTIYKLYISIH